MKEGYLVIDLGTGNSRIALCDLMGELVAVRSFENHYYQENKNPWAKYFRPDEWMDKIKCELHKLWKEHGEYQICAVTATSAREGIVLIDYEGIARIGLPNVDRRGTEKIDKYASFSSEIYRLSGHWLDPLFSAPKLVAYSEREKIQTFTSVSEWIGYELTGKVGISESQACETLLYDSHKFRWSDRLKKIFEIDDIELPKLYKAGAVLGYVKNNEVFNLCYKKEIPFIISGADTQMAVKGMEASDNDVVIVSGTTSPIVSITRTPIYDENERCWLDCIEKGKWMIETNAGTTGMNYQRYRNHFLPDMTYEEIENELKACKKFECVASFGTKFFAEKKTVEQGGIFMPAPFSNEINRVDIANAILADIACGITLHYEELKKIKSHEKDYIIGCGGGFQSPTLRERIAMLTNKKIVLPYNYEQASIVGCIRICQETLKKSSLIGKGKLIVHKEADAEIHTYYEKWKKIRKICENQQLM